VLGVPLALIDYEGTLDWIDACVAHGAPGYVCVAAVHTVMACREDPGLRAAVEGASFTVPDGQPLVWALNALGAGSITVSLLFDFNLSAFVVEAAWVAVSVYGLARSLRRSAMHDAPNMSATSSSSSTCCRT